jgi:hypothetical protein
LNISVKRLFKNVKLFVYKITPWQVIICIWKKVEQKNMDFLDPVAKRRHTIRLFIGYALAAILIIMGTWILMYRAYGFGVDRKTGEVIQNGLVFVDSAPDGAGIYIDGQQYKDQTNTRLALAAGEYNLEVRKDGYRDWKRSFSLEGGTVERFYYPLLVPTELKQNELATYDQAPAFATESPDRRWGMVSRGDSLTSFIVYDFNSLTEQKPDEEVINYPSSLFTSAPGPHSLELVEWSTDNEHLLVKHLYGGGHEFVVLSRNAPAASININRLIGQNPTSVALRDKKFDQWYIYYENGGLLQTADAKNTVSPFLNSVASFKTHDDDTIVFAKTSENGQTQKVFLQEGKELYELKEVPAGKVLLEIARYDDAWYVVVGSEAENKTYVYRDPQNYLKKRNGSKPAPVSVLRSNGPLTQVSFSQNTRFVLTQSGQHFEVYDAESNRTFRYDAPVAIDPNFKVVWMDGHRLLARSQGKAHIFEFDGQNKQELVPSLNNLPVFFDRDYTVMYAVNQALQAEGKHSFIRSSLRLPGDE